jgi:hypothetical protein
VSYDRNTTRDGGQMQYKSRTQGRWPDTVTDAFLATCILQHILPTPRNAAGGAHGQAGDKAAGASTLLNWPREEPTAGVTGARPGVRGQTRSIAPNCLFQRRRVYELAGPNLSRGNLSSFARVLQVHSSGSTVYSIVPVTCNLVIRV